VKFRRISIDGYGRFAGRTLEFAPGLQIIIGPNEKGKSTIRAFIGDMLYGQKRANATRNYDETNELRTPWETPDCYGGSLQYQLANGTEIEVSRNFDPKRESLQVFDRTQGREITSEFDLLRNREVGFAAAHLGLSKDVFLNTATITHFSLEDLGDGDALNQIREKLLSLADTGDDHNSADAALRLLAARIAAIGQPAARSKPLPSTRARLAEVRLEHSQALQVQQALADLADQRRMVLEEINALRKKRVALEEDLRVLDAHGRAARLREAESLHTRIDTATQHCFALSSAREFPLDRATELQRIAQKSTSAQTAARRTSSELNDVRAQLAAEKRHTGDEAKRPIRELPEDAEARFNEQTANAQVLRERLAEAEAGLARAQLALATAQDAAAPQPDYANIGADPVEWITQLASSFGVAVRSREDERRELAELNLELKQRRIDIADTHLLFKEHPDFLEKLRAYEQAKRTREDELLRCSATVQSLRAAAEDLSDRAPGFQWLAGLCLLGIIGLIIAFILLKSPAFLAAAGVVIIAGAYFLGNALMARSRLASMAMRIAEAETRLQDLSSQSHEEPALEELLRRSGKENFRELEALYDAYREASAELGARIRVLRQQEEKTKEAEDRVPRLLERLRETFHRVGCTIDNEADVKDAAARLIAGYNEYIAARRALATAETNLSRANAELEQAREAQSQNDQALRATEQEIRRFMRDAGFDDERTFDTTLAAVRAYRTRVQRQRELRARVEVLEERESALAHQAQTEEEDSRIGQEALQAILAESGATSVEQWEHLARQAREYHEVWARRGALEEQLASLLRDQDIHELRAAVEADGELPPPPKRPAAAIKSDLDACALQIDEKMKTEHGLHIAITQRGASMRSLNEVEEERAALEAQENALSLELEATAYAMAQIEEIARDKHARIAPRLASRASEHFATITNGAYKEVLISRDLNISVRIPQTKRMNEAPSKTLSKGTVDQLYLALRLALVEAISERGEPIPMLLDDPFANYDDGRLEKTMQLIANIAQHNQVMLFTCREDVARAAEAINAPIIRL